jgi:N-acetyl-gamma-glutamyl-phosphate reductase/acetylglutamate kinase
LGQIQHKIEVIGIKDLLDHLPQLSDVTITFCQIHFKRSYSQPLAQEHSFIEDTALQGTTAAVGANRLRQVIHDRDPGIVSSDGYVSGVLSEIEQSPGTIYGNEAFDVVVIVSHPEDEVQVMTKLLASRTGILNNVNDIIFNTFKSDHQKLFWTACPEDENRADGSFTRTGRTLFWYSIQDVREIERVISEYEGESRTDRAILPVGPAPPPHRLSSPSPASGLGARSSSTLLVALPLQLVDIPQPLMTIIFP